MSALCVSQDIHMNTLTCKKENYTCTKIKNEQHLFYKTCDLRSGVELGGVGGGGGVGVAPPGLPKKTPLVS